MPQERYTEHQGKYHPQARAREQGRGKCGWRRCSNKISSLFCPSQSQSPVLGAFGLREAEDPIGANTWRWSSAKWA